MLFVSTQKRPQSDLRSSSYTWQKTIDCGALTNKDTTVNVNIQNIKDIVFINGIVMMDGECVPLPNTEPNDNAWGLGISYNRDGYVKIRRTNSWGSAMNNSHAYITMQYTKTS